MSNDTASHTCEQKISLFVALSNVLAVLVKSFQNFSPKIAFRMDRRVCCTAVRKTGFLYLVQSEGSMVVELVAEAPLAEKHGERTKLSDTITSYT